MYQSHGSYGIQYPKNQLGSQVTGGLEIQKPAIQSQTPPLEGPMSLRVPDTTKKLSDILEVWNPSWPRFLLSVELECLFSLGASLEVTTFQKLTFLCLNAPHFIVNLVNRSHFWYLLDRLTPGTVYDCSRYGWLHATIQRNHGHL